VSAGRICGGVCGGDLDQVDPPLRSDATVCREARCRKAAQRKPLSTDRHCADCGCVLAADHDGPRCSPCFAAFCPEAEFVARLLLELGGVAA
jgi:hypothetical protein